MAAITVQSGPDDNAENHRRGIGAGYSDRRSASSSLAAQRIYSYLMPELAADLDIGHNIVATVLPNAIRCIAKTARKRNVRLARLSLWPGRKR